MTTDKAKDEKQGFHLEGGIAVFDARVDKLEREAAEAKGRDLEYRNEQLLINRRMMQFTGALVLCTVVAAFITGYQAHNAKLSADAARDNASAAKDQATASADGALATKNGVADAITNARMDQRAWIGVSNITGEPVLNEIWKIVVVVHNSGKTPARNLHGVSLPDPVKRGGNPNFSYAHDNHFVGGMIPPNGDFHATLIPTRSKSTTKPSQLTQPLLDSINAGDSRIYIHGQITYDDVFKCSYWMTYCYFWDPDTHGFAACREHNDTGEAAACQR
jgi:hypothetical protein